MKPIELRKQYLDFFRRKQHMVIPSSSLIPENDPSVLFTTAGMHPLVPFLLGEKHPAGKRLTNYQKCIRTGDIDKVGNAWHLTFFEMLGNWSLGDYGKKEAITWSYEFLTKELKIPAGKLAVTVFAGDKDAPFDQESYEVWKNMGLSEIHKYGKEDNWWGPAGKTGPCGPDTEMFYITDQKPCGPKCQPNDNCGRYAEIWNDVFMEYNKTAEGKYEPLKQKNVDTGMGLERTAAVLNGKDDNYQIGALKKALEKVKELSKKEDIKAERIIVDHVRAACFILAEGIVPSNVDQGYVLRRLIRRAIRQEKKLEIEKRFLFTVAEVFLNNYKLLYPELLKNKDFILEQLIREEEKFNATVEKGLKMMRKELETVAVRGVGTRGMIIRGKNMFSGKVAFNLYQTYGFPLEMIEEELKGVLVDKNEFQREFKKHQELSRQGAEKKFAGGLADHSKETTKLHTATHLLHKALRMVLGDYVAQKGSNINPERLRFDFSHPQKLTEPEKKKVEQIVNEQIKNKLPVTLKEMTVNQAKKEGAIGLFGEKYGDKVKVYSIGDFSKEICGGPHVKNTSELGIFKIIKEQAVSAGIRRIKAKLE
ncbi:MAG: alanine--tRNA ligase [Candidatus Kerfeldbacteria bacterium CG08_land_8_20_14_0_20_40_16]|uniref:Alanine--tRNA ligase n=1 Tax=Candidatus Kerfeldbacteria bacterium CG08_land_8_20_14_0_20_40_16 TaxID=2014244 RepID=A0A2H0YUH3_9BACT|nr:MAG: alanine--tRNA ligase [Candidatus Kerfeldbacteria bacterium CG08_land_8_20_14_0_20_40_16]